MGQLDSEIYSQELVQRLERIGHLGIWRLNLASRMFVPSRATNSYLGREWNDESPMPLRLLLDQITPEEAAHFQAGLTRMQKTGENFHGTYTFRGSWGVRSLLIDVEAEFDAAGKPVVALGVTRDITDIQRTLNESRENARLLERAQSVGRLGHWRIRHPGRILVWSPVLHDLIGVPSDQVVTARSLLQMFAPQHRARVRVFHDDYVARREPFEYTADLIRPDDTTITVHVVGEPDYDADGQYVGYFGITQDVTLRTRAQRDRAVLEGRQETMLDALDHAGIGICLQDGKGLITSVRPALLAMSGFDNEGDLVGQRWSHLNGAGGTDIEERFLQQVSRDPDSVRRGVELNDIEWVRPDGTRRYFFVRIVMLPGPARLVVVIDETDRRRVRQALEEREKTNRAVLDAIDNAGVGICVQDAEGRNLSVSNSMVGMLRTLTRDQVIGRRWRELVDLPESLLDVSETGSARDGATIGKEAPSGTIVGGPVVRGDGSLFYFKAFAAPLPGVGRLLLVVDITRERELERQQAENDRRIQELQKMEAVGQLAGGMAHEVNNMLHPIRTFARAARNAATAEDRERYISRVVECADKAGGIVRQVLSFARRDGMTAQVCVLNDLVTRVVGFSRDLAMHGIELELDLPDRQVLADVNETEFTQVLLNLLKNAADATGGAGIVRVALSSVPTSRSGLGRMARIDVADAGCGMSAEVMQRATEPFFTTKGPGRGTGLGLSVVFGIVSRWGGKLEFDSIEGKGTTATILLPEADNSFVASPGG